MTRLLLISLTLLVLSGCGGSYWNNSKPDVSVTEEGEETQAHPLTIQVPKTLNGLHLVQYADRALDLDRVPVENIKVAVVNPQSVLERTKAGRRALAALKEDVRTKHNVLRTVEQDLRAQEVTVKKIPESNPDRTAVLERFNNAITAYKEKASGFNDDLKARQAELVQEYIEKIETITGRVASKSEIDLVLDNFGSLDQAKANVPLPILELMKRATNDLTVKVIEEFDRTYK